MNNIENFDIKCLQEAFVNNKILKIYKGKDDFCRCGCGGKYYKVSDKHFKKIFNNAVNAFNFLKEYGDNKHTSRFDFEEYNNESYVNIPIFNELKPDYNQCYCIYITK